MFYGIIRLVSFLVIFILIFVLLKKAGRVKKKTVIILLAAAVILCVLSYTVPVENLFVSFGTPQNAFEYSGSGNITDVIYGKDSCLVISTKEYKFFPEKSGGYKLPGLNSAKTVCESFDENGSFEIYNVQGTEDHYIWGTTVAKGNDISISDSSSSQFEIKAEKIEGANIYTISIYGYINDFSYNYSLNVNGVDINFEISS